MTHPLELLTKVATAGAGHAYAIINEGSGGGPKQTVSMRPDSLMHSLGYALGRLDAPASSLLLLKYGDGGIQERQILLLSTVSYLLRERERRRLPKQHRAEITPENAMRVALAATQECLSPRACPNCRGTAHDFDGSKKVACPQCRGVGFKAWTYERRADLMGCARSTYHRKKWLYGVAIDYLRRLEQTARHNMRERLQ